MQKTLIGAALSAAAVLPVAAHADTANFNFYGKIDVDIEQVKSDVVANPATDADKLTRLQSNASRFGFKGKEDLGGGLNAIYQFEAQIDSVNDKNAKNPFNGTRNSRLGMQGGFGTFFYGNWDSPFKRSHNKIELFGNTTVFTTAFLMGRTGNGKSYVTRQNNVVEYMSPKMSGLSIEAAHSLDSSQTATTNKTTTSIAGMYDNGALYAALAYETRADQTTATKSDTALRLVAAYKFGPAMLGATFEKMSVANTLNTTASQNNSELVATYTMGATSLGIAYAKAGDYNDVTDTGASQVSLRYGFKFSKRTSMYAGYTAITNGKATSTYGFFPNKGVGSKQTGFGVGMAHSF